ncbi:hypothetical protein EIP86_008088 [Pleurotus ostreatoroseus]|nr:hypothetical protein EIP86_008088 [Pleurotus ostreatoroseus]
MESLASIEVADRWVTCLAWTHWVPTQPNQCVAYLACSIADGSVVVVKVTQTLQSDLGQSFVAKQEIELSSEIPNEQPDTVDGRKISSMKWIQVPKCGPVLVFTKPGTVHLWSALFENPLWNGVRTILLQTQKLTIGSSSLSPVSGIAYSPARDALVLSLADGSFHVVSSMSTNPSLCVTDPVGGLSSGALSSAARADFLKIEEEPRKNSDVNATHGMVTYDQSSFYLWIHESSRPSDFNYKHDAKHNSMFVCAQLWEDNLDKSVMDFIESAVFSPKAALGEAPLSILRPAFVHLQNAATLARLSPSICALLQRTPSADVSISMNLPSWTGELTPDLRQQFRTSLRTELFGWDSFLSQRLQISLAGFCEKQVQEIEKNEHSLPADKRPIPSFWPQQKEQFGQAERNLILSLWPRLLRVFIRHIVAVWNVLTPDDVHFVRRIAVQALLPSVPADIVEEARALLNHAQAAGMPAPTSDELCPACHAPVPLTNETTATCPNGHVWGASFISRPPRLSSRLLHFLPVY